MNFEEEAFSIDQIGAVNNDKREEKDIEEFQAYLKTKKKIKKKKITELSNYYDSFSYMNLLERLYENKPDYQKDIERKNLPKPKVVFSNKKTFIHNFAYICKNIQRSNEHVKQFICVELSCTGSIGGNGELILRNRVREPQFLTLLTKYINKYVKCRHCKSLNTTSNKDKDTRLWFVKCSVCKANDCVEAIKTDNFRVKFRGRK